MRVDEVSFELGGGVGAAANQQTPTSRIPPRGPPMSQISGVKRPLSHTNSFAGERLPTYGVETPHELPLGRQLAEVDTWGTDIFKIGDLSNNRPLTSVAYVIFKVCSRNYLDLALSTNRVLCIFNSFTE